MMRESTAMCSVTARIHPYSAESSALTLMARMLSETLGLEFPQGL